MSKPHNLSDNPVHLGLGASATKEPTFTGMAWYADYVERHASDGNEARLVAMYTFGESWNMWEMHPQGDEVVICTAGRMVLVQELADGSHNTTTLSPGEYAINPAGIWHTADVETDEATAIFITAGVGTEHRNRV